MLVPVEAEQGVDEVVAHDDGPRGVEIVETLRGEDAPVGVAAAHVPDRYDSCHGRSSSPTHSRV